MNESSLAPAAELMNDLCSQLLAGTRLPADQTGSLRPSDLLEEAIEVLHRRAFTDKEPKMKTWESPPAFKTHADPRSRGLGLGISLGFNCSQRTLLICKYLRPDKSLCAKVWCRLATETSLHVVSRNHSNLTILEKKAAACLDLSHVGETGRFTHLRYFPGTGGR